LKNWIALAVIFGGVLAYFVFKLGEEKEKTETLESSKKETRETEEKVAREIKETPKMVELSFSDGSKLVLDEKSPYYQDFLDYADKILSKEERNAKERTNRGSA